MAFKIGNLFFSVIFIPTLFSGCLRWDELNDPTLIDIQEIHPESLPDGVYRGRYRSIAIAVVADVSIADGTVTKINLVHHRSGQGAPAGAITNSIIEAQSVKIDAVSGATMSSYFILKAVSEALNK